MRPSIFSSLKTTFIFLKWNVTKIAKEILIGTKNIFPQREFSNFQNLYKNIRKNPEFSQLFTTSSASPWAVPLPSLSPNTDCIDFTAGLPTSVLTLLRSVLNAAARFFQKYVRSC